MPSVPFISAMARQADIVVIAGHMPAAVACSREGNSAAPGHRSRYRVLATAVCKCYTQNTKRVIWCANPSMDLSRLMVRFYLRGEPWLISISELSILGIANVNRGMHGAIEFWAWCCVQIGLRWQRKHASPRSQGTGLFQKHAIARTIAWLQDTGPVTTFLPNTSAYEAH